MSAYYMLTRIFLQAIVEKSVPSFRRENEVYKAMSNHTGSIWGNVTDGANRRKGPGQNFDKIDNLPARTSLIVLCWSRGQSETWTTPPLPTAPHGVKNTSDAWDFVVTSDQDPGGYVADVFIDTGGDIRDQLKEPGRCNVLKQRLANS